MAYQNVNQSIMSAVLAVGILIRLTFIGISVFVDQFSVVKYTDIDYFVFTDAARSRIDHTLWNA